METAFYVIGWANNALLVALSILAVMLARRTRTSTGWLLAAAIGTFTIATLTGWLPWAVGTTDVHMWFSKFRLELQILFPYLLLRLAHAFRPFSVLALRAATVAAILIAAFVLAIPVNVADSDLDITAPTVVALFLSYVGWVVIALLAVARRFRIAGRGQPGSIRRRMYVLSSAAVWMLLAYLTAFASWAVWPLTMIVISMLLVAGSTVAFVIGVAPTTSLRLRWRRDEEHALREAIVALLAAETREDVLVGILPKVRRMVGASAVAFVHDDGAIEHADGAEPHAERLLVDALRREDSEDPGHQLTMVPFGSAQLALRTTPVTPLVGDAELELLEWVGSVVELAFARCQHLAEDRAVTDRLREVDRLKSEFVQIVAHDLRSPMSAVAGLAGTLQLRWEDIDADTKLTMLDNIGSSTQRMADLVVDVLDIARIESGELRYDIAPFDLVGVVRDAVEDLQLGEETRRVELHLDDGVALPLALGDQRRHRQVVANLLSNALKYSPEDARVDVDVTWTDDELVVGVRDRGDGIPPSEQGRIFEKFGRAVAPSDATPGSGLGLYICKAMVEAQGGRIWVESVPGAGATFRFTAPVASH